MIEKFYLNWIREAMTVGTGIPSHHSLASAPDIYLCDLYIQDNDLANTVLPTLSKPKRFAFWSGIRQEHDRQCCLYLGTSCSSSHVIWGPFTWGVKWLGYAANHQFTTNSVVKKAWMYTSNYPYAIASVMLRPDILILILTSESLDYKGQDFVLNKEFGIFLPFQVLFVFYDA
jgi:hypothetical protein